MVKKRVRFTFPKDMIKEPVIYRLGRKFPVVTNIRRANVTEDSGWVVLELEGKEPDIDAGLQWVAALGVRIDPISGDVIEG